MKKLSVLTAAVFIVFGACGQASVKKEVTVSGPKLTFEKKTFDFGDIHQGDKVEHIFTLDNAGNEPLIVTNVQTTCGCTASSWPHDPILPGQSADIKITFNSTGKMGRQNKIITIISNAANQDNNKLTIAANVLPKKEDVN